MTKAAPRAAGAARVLGQAATGAVFAIFFGLAGAATATAKEGQQPPGGGGSACKASTGGGCTPMGGDKGDSNEGRKDQGPKARGHVEMRQAKPEKQTRKPSARTPERPRSRDDDDRDRDKDDDKPRKDEGKGKDEDKDKDKPEKDRDERSGGDRRHDDDDGGKSEKDRNDDNPEKNRDDDDDDKPVKGKPVKGKKDKEGEKKEKNEKKSSEKRRVVRADSSESRPRTVESRVMPVSATSVPTQLGGPFDDDGSPIQLNPFCDSAGCEAAARWLKDIFPGAVHEGPSLEGGPIAPDGKGGFGGYEGGAYLDSVRIIGPDGRDLGGGKVGVDGKVEGGLSLTDPGIKGEASGFLGFRPVGPEVNGPLGPVDVSGSPSAPLGLNANVEAGLTANEGLQLGAGIDATQKVQAPEFKLDLGGGFAITAQPEGWVGPGVSGELGMSKGQDGKLHIQPKGAISPGIGGGLGLDLEIPLTPPEVTQNAAAERALGGR